MKNKEKQPMSIKWKLFLFLAIFVVLIIALLWILQVVFLDDFYKSTKVNEIRLSSQIIQTRVRTGEDISSLITFLSEENDMAIIVAKEDGTVLYQAAERNGSMLFRVTAQQFYEWMRNAKQNGGVYTEIFQGFTIDAFPGSEPGGGKPNELRPNDGGMLSGFYEQQSILHASIAKMADGTEVVILLNSDITPVDATVQTIQKQLVMITGILLLGALLLAFIISIVISEPIMKINNASKELAKGNYNVSFEGDGYKEIQELSQTLNYAKDELSQLDDYRRELMANVSHDLRTPLTLITGYAEMMRDLPGENNEENAQVIIEEAQRLSILVNDVLELSQFETNNQSLHLEKFDLTESIQTVIERIAKMTEPQGYTISFIAEEHIVVRADALKLSQVIYNLVGNAITHTGENQKVIVRQDVSKDTVRISVIDFGQGIPKEALPKIWERYYKVDKEHKRAQVGTGLGLSIVKSIFDLHHMRYGVSSEVGKGSTFWFELPVEDDK